MTDKQKGRPRNDPDHVQTQSEKSRKFREKCEREGLVESRTWMERRTHEALGIMADEAGLTRTAFLATLIDRAFAERHIAKARRRDGFGGLLRDLTDDKC